MINTLSFLISFAVSALTGLWLIPFLRKLKAGQQIREVGPKWHLSKQGTPTMGGLMFVAGIVVSVIITGWNPMRKGEYTHVIVLGLAVFYGLIGFFDDLTKVRNKRNLGLTAIQKLVLQVVAAAAFLAALRYAGILENTLFIPFFNVTYTVPWVIYLILALFIIVGGVNAVNLTDGVDGLAAGVTVPVAAFFTAAALRFGNSEISLFSASLAGALVGFLLYNFHPAKIFMGDTGSLFLGGAVCACAFALNIPLIIIPAGIIYILETLSDIVQVIYFKFSHGKRVFLMAPYHHHLEMKGWKEVRIVGVFVLITVIGCVLAYLTLI
ncbi:MAG: phospho-N-acetylmuramoyl-pentapeptide-transferase [Clostridiales bacterium]|jgi:phospho-N-acetylmuramoyl-pentapeptide-transferase|nr:phospho-N-acetylmuramoyl-pentapeptide-transferase [Clostridiales bacterium]